MFLSFGFTALSKQLMNACHSLRRPLNLFISNFSNFARISTVEAAVAPLKNSPDWELKLMFPDEVLGVVGIDEFICRDFRVKSMPTTAHALSSVISLASATSCSMDSTSFSSPTSSKILLLDFSRCRAFP